MALKLASDTGPSIWECRCDCGTVKPVRAHQLTAGSTRSCGCLHAEVVARGAHPRNDIAGLKFGKLTAISLVPGKGDSRWNCECECGNRKVVAAVKLIHGRTKSCGCLAVGAKLQSLVGQRFGRLTVLSLAAERGRKPRWLCKCDCGNQKSVFGNGLKDGTTKSCGCYRRETSSFNRPPVDLAGQRFSLLTVVSREEGRGKARWRCLCDCGTEKIVYAEALRSGKTKSCGCRNSRLRPSLPTTLDHPVIERESRLAA